MRIVTGFPAGDDRVEARRRPRSDIVEEAADGPGRFRAVSGPFSRYERVLEDHPDGSTTETIDCALAVPVWGFLFWLPVRAALRGSHPDGHQAWWAPPDRFDPRAATVLGLLATLALVEGYLGTLLTQTITFAADEMGATSADQGRALAGVRIGALLALALSARADRDGRRRLLLSSLALACAASCAGAVAPSLAWLAATQVVATGGASAAILLLAVVAAEEMPAGSRAYALSLVTMAGGLGAGACLAVLPVADLGERGWRVAYVVPALGFVVVRWVGRHLPESARFARPHDEAVTLEGHGRRLVLLAAVGFLVAVFAAPASQLQNDFLREEQGFSAARVSLFSILTGTPAAIGVVVGGRLSDRHGRRVVGAVGMAGGTIATVVAFRSSGWPLWAWGVAGGILGALTIPTLLVYRPELFPTNRRGRASGIVQAVTVAGSALGLITVGNLVDRGGSYGGPMAMVGVGPLLAALAVLALFPETAGRELEELNPEDRLSPD